MSIANTEQAEIWNTGEGVAHWVRNQERYARMLSPFADLILQAAALRPDEQVLDVGCGFGVTTLAAARLVAPGSALGVDLSEPLLSLARERAAALKRERGASRGLAFEQLVSEIFQKAGGQVLETKAGADRGGDLIVWQNDVAFETGGPMLVECKHYGGRSGSIVANARHTVERLEKLVRASDARLALLVLSYDLAKQPPHRFETPWF